VVYIGEGREEKKEEEGEEDDEKEKAVGSGSRHGEHVHVSMRDATVSSISPHNFRRTEREKQKNNTTTKWRRQSCTPQTITENS
jgi:hypothetical protein